jgi:hypothetical protein
VASLTRLSGMQCIRRPRAVSERRPEAQAASSRRRVGIPGRSSGEAAEGFTFGLGLEPAMPWSAYLKTLDGHRTGMNLRAGLVPQTLLVADVGGEIVGRTSVRRPSVRPSVRPSRAERVSRTRRSPYWPWRPSAAPAAWLCNRDTPAEPCRGQGQRGRAGTSDLRRQQHWLDSSHRKVRRSAGFHPPHWTSSAPVLVRLNHCPVARARSNAAWPSCHNVPLRN